ncbi:MAG TPA: vWA domain-containing protein [Candidatus Sulfotelmatobacter sp.]|nr:vWA domain-containing protein [Candidatus Sulfotelmatobacter sp.]
MKFFCLPIMLCVALPLSSQGVPSSGPPLNLHYALLNDTSGKTLWPRGMEQQVYLASQFLEQVVRPGTDIGSLVNFGEKFYLDVQNSTKPADIKAKLIREGHSGTSVFDAVVAAANWLDKYQFRDSRKAIFLFSDGDDNASRWPLVKTIASVQAVHIPVFVIAPAVVEHKKQGKDLGKLATATGGHVYFVSKTETYNFAALKHDLGR